MKINYNDRLAKSLYNNKFYNSDINPLYIKLLLFYDESILNKLYNKHERLIEIEHIFENNPKLFNRLLKFAIENGFLNDLIIRYEFNNSYNKQKNEDNCFVLLKYKVIDNHLYVYDEMLSLENQKLLEVTAINGYPISDILEKFYNQGYTLSQILILIQHKEILSSYGFKSDKYEITIEDEKLKIDLSDPEIKINHDIFYKEHAKSQLLDKSSFDLNMQTGSEHFYSSYGYDSNIKLLKMLHGLSKNEKVNKLLEDIYKKNIENIGYGESDDTNIDWMFISSFFLMNQEEKHDFPDYLYLDLERKLKLVNNTGAWIIFLNEKNEETSYGYNVSNDSFGCNSYIYENGKCNTRQLFHALRNALAHSSYEVINENYIRVYGFIENTNIMNVNFKIKKNIVLDFIDKISQFRNFGDIFPICTLKEPNVGNERIKNESELISYLKNIIVSDLDIKSYNDLDRLKQLHDYESLIKYFSNPNPDLFNYDYTISSAFEYDYLTKIYSLKSKLKSSIIEDSKNIKDIIEKSLKVFADYEYKEFALSDEQVSNIIKRVEMIKDSFFDIGASNQHIIITELIKNELNPNRNITFIIPDIIRTKGKENGNIMDMLDETSTKIVQYDNVVKATIIAYLNNILLYNFNGNKIDCSGLDFTDMIKDLTSLIETKRKNIESKIINNRNNRDRIIKNERRIKILEQRYIGFSDDDSLYLEEKNKKS